MNTKILMAWLLYIMATTKAENIDMATYWQSQSGENPAQYQIVPQSSNSVTINLVILSGLVKYTGFKEMGSQGSKIGEINDTNNACPSNPEIFSVTNGYAVDCTVEIRRAENGKCPIYLLAWSIPNAYYHTDDAKYYVMNDAELIKAASTTDSSYCKCASSNIHADCVMVYTNGGSGTCFEARHYQFVSLDGIAYVAKVEALTTPPKHSITLVENGPWTNNANRLGQLINAATYTYNGIMVSLAGSIQYCADPTASNCSAKPVMGQIGNGKIGTIATSYTTNLCPKNDETFRATNGYGLDCIIEIRKKSGNTCDIYLLSWSMPLAYYYTGAYDSVEETYYVVNDKAIV
eukprot:430936_1